VVESDEAYSVYVSGQNYTMQCNYSQMLSAALGLVSVMVASFMA
jgi:hypothetical protein